MSGDESRGGRGAGAGSRTGNGNGLGGRRPRPLAPPRLPPGALREFKRHLYRLYLTAGAPALETVVDSIAGDDTLPGAPGKDTVHRIIGGTRLPGLHDVRSVAAVLARARAPRNRPKSSRAQGSCG